jgi:hypothetical protein
MPKDTPTNTPKDTPTNTPKDTPTNITTHSDLEATEPVAATEPVEAVGVSEPSSARPQPNDPLHGITLKTIVTELHAHYGWNGLGSRIKVNCFLEDPSVNSSLKFLRKTPWAREKVEALYLFMVREQARKGSTS